MYKFTLGDVAVADSTYSRHHTLGLQTLAIAGMTTRLHHLIASWSVTIATVGACRFRAYLPQAFDGYLDPRACKRPHVHCPLLLLLPSCSSGRQSGPNNSRSFFVRLGLAGSVYTSRYSQVQDPNHLQRQSASSRHLNRRPDASAPD